MEAPLFISAVQVSAKPLVPRRDNAIDCFVGRRLHERRVTLSITQEALGAIVGVSKQQVHHYERGENQLTADRLYRLSQALGVSVSFFFDGFQPPTTRQSG